MVIRNNYILWRRSGLTWQWAKLINIILVSGLAIFVSAPVAIAGSDVEALAGEGACVSVNGNYPNPPGAVNCATQVQGDRAIAIRNSNAVALGDENRYGPAQATARDNSTANAQLGSTAQATNFSAALATFGSWAYADESSLADAQNNSSATATGGDSSAIAIGSSVAVATNGACAYARSDPNQPSSVAVADGPGVIVTVINGVQVAPEPTRQCRTWPPSGAWPG